MSTTKSLRSRTSLVVLAVVTLAGARGWVTTATDTITHTVARKWVSMQALSVDSAGTLHACWTESQTVSLKYVMCAKKPAGDDWTMPEIVAESANNHAAIAVEKRTGVAHVAWAVQVGGAADVFYATNRTGRWAKTRLTEDALEQWLPTIALEADSLPHLAWVVRDSAGTYHITYSSRRSGAWQTQTLIGSELGGFGSGACPWLAVAPEGVAHIVYRGGDYGNYHIHHAENSAPGDTTWTYEVLYSENLNDFTSAVAAYDSGELRLVCSGNDGWGFPFRTCYLQRPPNSSQWAPSVLMTASASAAMRGFTTDGEVVHATWEEINGNVNTEKIYHVSNVSGLWYNSAIRDDRRTSFGAIAVDPGHCGHALVLVDSMVDSDSQQVVCVHSAPFTGVAEPKTRTRLGRMTATLHRVPVQAPLPESSGDVGVYDALGRQVRRLSRGSDRYWDGTDQAGCVVRAGIYLFVSSHSSQPIVVVR